VVRLVVDDVPVYVHPEGPDWFVPSEAADTLLRELVENRAANGAGAHTLSAVPSPPFLLERIRPRSFPSYSGRAAFHRLSTLKECWFHITNRCDMTCTHCMFSSGGSADTRELPPALLRRTVGEAMELGTRIFFFTGGEPFVYPGFTSVCDEILERDDTHVVVLTNGRRLLRHETWFDSLPAGRLHLQVSIDGDRVRHDAVRGDGAYEALLGSLEFLRARTIPVTLAMSVGRHNLPAMTSVVETASRFDVSAVHFMWLFRRGRAARDDEIGIDSLTEGLLGAWRLAQRSGVVIDNIEALRSQVFMVPGTRFDLAGSGWESLAVGPDGGVYPSPALVGMPDLHCGHVSDGVETIWRHSPVLERVRAASLVDSPGTGRDPLRFLVGGGDMDHSFHAAGTLVGDDPHLPLYRAVVGALIAEHAREHREPDGVGLRCRMGECLSECGPDSGPVMFTHSNCVQSLAGNDSHGLVRSFYSRAAETTNEEILNPVSYGEENLDHIPREMRVRSYGCGSPVLDCDLKPGMRIADLGSGTGIECFIAAKAVGPAGRVYGIDMSRAMLDRAEEGRKRVAANLGYANVEFRAGLLEKIGLEDNSLDFVISNCVVNLAADKRSVFEEIFRVLKPGGSLCISDIVTMTDIPIEMKYNERMRGECLGGAMRQRELFAVVAEVGFECIYLVRRYEYRRVNDYPFYAITYRAEKPRARARTSLIYRGPHRSVTVEDGTVVARGYAAEVDVGGARLNPDAFFVLDELGQVSNVEQETACGVFVNPAGGKAAGSSSESTSAGRRDKDCIVCGAPLEYFPVNRSLTCTLCGLQHQANAACVEGHFVCDQCHRLDAAEVTIVLCRASTETDPVALFERISSHPAFPLHGPQYHSLVPAVIVAAYRNAGGNLPAGAIATAVERGSTVAGGSCAFLGACGAALGAGTALSIILGGTPLNAEVRRTVQTVTAGILARIGAFSAARCCRRDCLIAITQVVELSADILSVPLHAESPRPCAQSSRNEHCIGPRCPWWSRKKDAEADRAPAAVTIERRR